MNEYIATITLAEDTHPRNADMEHELRVALADLLAENSFTPMGLQAGPYTVLLKQQENRVIFEITSAKGAVLPVMFSVHSLKKLVRDYFLVCESYYEALRSASACKIESIDMGRRGLHNEGAEMLKELLHGKIEVDFETARRLFTLVSVLLAK